MKKITIPIFLIIITLSVGIIVPRFIGQLESSHNGKEFPKSPPNAHIGLVEAAIDTYKVNTNKLPEKLEDLIICPPGLEGSWAGPYLKQSQLYDSWDKPFIYEPNSADQNRYVIISYGEDGIPGGEGYNKDIYNK